MNLAIIPAGKVLFFQFDNKEDQDLFKHIISGVGILKLAMRKSSDDRKLSTILGFSEDAIQKVSLSMAFDRLKKMHEKGEIKDLWRMVVTEDLPFKNKGYFLGAVKEDLLKDIDLFLENIKSDSKEVEEVVSFLKQFKKDLENAK